MSSEARAGSVAYRFGPRDRRGLVAGLRSGQVLVVAASLVVAVGCLRSLRGASGAALAVAAVAAGTACSFWPLGGRTVEEWTPVVARFLVAVLARRGPSVERAGGLPGSLCAPRPFSGLEIRPVELAGRGFGAVHDRRRRTWTAALSIGGGELALVGEDERERRLAAWSGVLAAMARESGSLRRLQWIERAVPDRGELLAGAPTRKPSAGGDRTAAPPPHGGGGDYEQLVAEEGRNFLRHELLLVCSVAEAAGTGALDAELQTLLRRCAEAGLAAEGPLSAAGLRLVLRQAFDESPTRQVVSWPWPVAVRPSWSEVTTDGLSHVTYWIAEWPRTDVRGDFLLPLLVGVGVRRVLSVVMAPVPPLRAVRAAEHARTAKVADAELRHRHGFAVTARSRREHDAVERREQELAAGHVGYRFSGYVTVSAPSGELAVACGRIEQAAALSRLELRRLYGSQDEALLFALPLGRGCW